MEPDQLSLLAVLDENAHLRLYDRATQRAGAALTGFPAGYPMWSRDGRYLYFENNSSTAWYRVGVEQRRVISARTVNPSNLYALDWASQ